MNVLEEMCTLLCEKVAQQKALDEEIDDLKRHVEGLMMEKDTGQVKTARGVVTRRERIAWVFSEAVKEKKNEVKMVEEAEKKSGIAKSQTSRFLETKVL